MPAPALLASLLFVQPVTAGFSEDPAQASIWLQQACRIQQVGYSGGVPVDHTEFCTCFDRNLREASTDDVYRVFALGSQGAVREQGLIEDWESARDTAAAEAGAMAPEVQASFTTILQSSLMACMNFSFQGE
ncbi:hypothetical protein SAMN04488568_10736 [Maricaulis salignorans]|uniref:Rap1a immunity protein domain-containing protein n=2 Tax=Maricaulis salignorans TaxID=144026 RepID=A0A1G9RI41_9PROT|nr:hypothetical protein SAMN04488568_10736 [Maricaulis salignorans]